MKKLLEKIYKNKLLVSIIGCVILGILIFFTFFYDIGLNSKYFVKKDFSEAFLLRQTGNCEEFVKYINQDWANWVSLCYGEKNRVNGRPPINTFEVKEISIKGNRSFLQVEIQRNNPTTDSGSLFKYVVNYEMIRIKGRWFIDQSYNKI